MNIRCFCSRLLGHAALAAPGVVAVTPLNAEFTKLSGADGVRLTQPGPEGQPGLFTRGELLSEIASAASAAGVVKLSRKISRGHDPPDHPDDFVLDQDNTETVLLCERHAEVLVDRGDLLRALRRGDRSWKVPQAGLYIRRVDKS